MTASGFSFPFPFLILFLFFFPFLFWRTFSRIFRGKFGKFWKPCTSRTRGHRRRFREARGGRFM